MSSPSAQDGLSPRSALPRFTLGSVLWCFGSLVNRILRFGQSFNSMKVTRCFHFFSSTSGQRKTCVSGFKSLIKSFIHRPACWRKVRENKLSHRVLFKLSDPFQHALPASLLLCVWGLGWGGRGKKKNPDGRKPMDQLAPFQSSLPPAPSPPSWAQASANLFCTHTHCTTQATKWLSNNFAHKCHSTPSLAPCAFSSPPPLQALPPNKLDRFQCLKAHLTTPFCLEMLSLDLILSTLPRGGGCWGFLRILQGGEKLQEPSKLQEGLCPLCSSPHAIENPQKESVYHSWDHTGWLPLLLLCTFLPLKTSLLACLGAESQCHAWLALSFDG